MRRPSHVVRVHGRLRHTASVNAARRSSGTGVGFSGRPSLMAAAAPSAKASVDSLPRFGAACGRVRHPSHVVERLARTLEGSTAQRCVVLAVAEDPGPALGRVGLVRRGPAVELVERALAEDRADGDVGRRAQPFVQFEVRIAAARDREALVEAADLFEQRTGNEHAVALPHAVEPIAITDEVTDLEQAITGAGPLDGVEQPVLVFPVVAVVHRVALLSGADVPLLRDDDRRRVGLQSRHAEVEHTRRQHVCPVDHQREGAAPTGPDPVVEREDGRWSGIGCQVEIAELGAE